MVCATVPVYCDSLVWPELTLADIMAKSICELGRVTVSLRRSIASAAILGLKPCLRSTRDHPEKRVLRLAFTLPLAPLSLQGTRFCDRLPRSTKFTVRPCKSTTPPCAGHGSGRGWQKRGITASGPLYRDICSTGGRGMDGRVSCQ